MDHFQIDQLQVDKNRNGPDPHEPPDEDELYYGLNGFAAIEAGGEKKPVSPASAVFFPAHIQHKFSTEKEELKVVVIFSTPDGSGS